MIRLKLFIRYHIFASKNDLLVALCCRQTYTIFFRLKYMHNNDHHKPHRNAQEQHKACMCVKDTILLDQNITINAKK